MNFGKREQMVGLFVSGILTIGGMHWAIFGPRAKELSTAVADVDAKKTQISEFKSVGDMGKVTRLAADNKKLETFYNDAISSMGLSFPTAFQVPRFEETDIEEAAKKDKNEMQVMQLRQLKFADVQKAKFAEQVQLVVSEIEKLYEYDSRRNPNKAGITKTTFMEDRDGAWRLPASLPNGIQGGKLVDLLSEGSDTVSIIRNIPIERKDLLAAQRNYYENLLLQLGIDDNLYRQPTMTSLHSMGEYVPLIQKMAHADLIEKELAKNPELAKNRGLDRTEIFKLLEIDAPLHEMVEMDGKPAKINEMYFVYASLQFINTVLPLMVEAQIAEVAGIRCDEASFLVDQGQTGQPMYDPKVTPTPKPTPVTQNPFVLPGAEETKLDPKKAANIGPHGRVASKRGTTDIGYSIPITFQYRTNNNTGMKFIYDVIRRFPLLELDAVDFVSDRTRVDSENIWFSIRFLVVPYIFAIQEQPAAVGPVAAAPGAKPATPAAGGKPAAAPAAGK